VQERNFDSYNVLRMSEVPPMDIKVISNDHEPTGIGEAGVPVIAPAIANAVAQTVGQAAAALADDAGSGQTDLG